MPHGTFFTSKRFIPLISQVKVRRRDCKQQDKLLITIILNWFCWHRTNGDKTKRCPVTHIDIHAHIIYTHITCRVTPQELNQVQMKVIITEIKQFAHHHDTFISNKQHSKIEYLFFFRVNYKYSIELQLILHEVIKYGKELA